MLLSFFTECFQNLSCIVRQNSGAGLYTVPERFAPKPFPPLVVSPPRRFPEVVSSLVISPPPPPPGRFPCSRFAPKNNVKLNCTNELNFYELLTGQ